MVVIIIHLQEYPRHTDFVLSVWALIPLWLMESDRKVIWRTSLIWVSVIAVEPGKTPVCWAGYRPRSVSAFHSSWKSVVYITWCSSFPKGKHMNESRRVPSHLTRVLTCSHCCLLEESLFSHPLLRKPRKLYWKAQLPALEVAKFAFPTAGKLWVDCS